MRTLNELVLALLGAKRDEEAARHAARAFEMLERIEVPPQTAANTRFAYAQTLWPGQKERSLALARQARDELRAQGDEKGAKGVEEWLGER
jgi:hypothetical protein